MSPERKIASPTQKAATNPMGSDSGKWVEIPIKADRSNFKKCGGGPLCDENK